MNIKPWDYLTDRFLARSFTQTSSAFHQQLLNISSKWRFAHSRLHLLYKRAKLILRLKPFTPQPHPTCRQAHFPFHQIFEKATLHLLQKSKNMSPQTQFQQLISEQFSYYLQIFTMTSVSEQPSGFHPCLFTFHSPSPPSRRYFM